MRSGILAGIRVVSIAVNVPVPLAAARLAAEGASVAKIEPPAGDPLARLCPDWYVDLHRQVEVLQLDLKAAAGHQRFRELLRDADLLLSSSRPSSLSRIQLDDESLRRGSFPRLRWLNIVGELDRPEVPGHDATYVARAGLIAAELPRTLMADVFGAERAFATALLLLRQPPGSSATVGLYDSLDALVAPLGHGLTRPGGLLGGSLPHYRMYETLEGHAIVAALEPRFRERLYGALGLPLDSDLTDVMRTKSAAEWEAWAAERDIPICAVRDGSRYS